MNEKLKALKAKLATDKSRHIQSVVALCLILALIVALCITINMRANIQRRYTAVRDRAGASLYADLNMMAQTFDMINVPTADVQYAILPQMKELFHSALALNELITECYSPKYTLLGESDIASIESAFSAYETAYRDATSTDLAESNMRSCMSRVRELLNARYTSGILRAMR